MYFGKAQRNKVYLKYNKRCAYSGTILNPDWQIDHVKPILRNKHQKFSFPQFHHIDNLVPCQREINHMKGSYDLEYFRTVRLGQLHRKLRHLPEYPTTIKALKDKEYHIAIANYFGISPEKPFSGIFFFEKNR